MHCKFKLMTNISNIAPNLKGENGYQNASMYNPTCQLITLKLYDELEFLKIQSRYFLEISGILKLAPFIINFSNKRGNFECLTCLE